MEFDTNTHPQCQLLNIMLFDLSWTTGQANESANPETKNNNLLEKLADKYLSRLAE